MKKYLLSLFLICACIATTMGVKKVEANPINVAVMLIQEKDSASLASTLDYYGYTRANTTLRHLKPESPLTPDTSTPDTYKVFTHPNGSTIRYKLSDQNTPIVEVTSKASAKERDKILQNLNFQKNGNSYAQKSVRSLIKCSFGPHGTLILTRHPKPKE